MMLGKPLLKERLVGSISLKLYRSTKSNSISITDIQMGLWCEIQAEYGYLHLFLKQTYKWRKMEEKGRPVQLKTPEMKQGTDIHLAKGTRHIVLLSFSLSYSLSLSLSLSLTHTHKFYSFVDLV